MRFKKLNYILFIILPIITLDCSTKTTLEGKWNLKKTKIWDGYGEKTIDIELGRNSFYVQNKSFDSKVYRDSIFKLMKESYLLLNNDSTFQFLNNGLLVASLSDLNWMGKMDGKWMFNREESIISFRKSSGLVKRYKVLKLTKSSLKIGELYQSDLIPFTEMTLSK
jgi:hypothetical protein